MKFDELMTLRSAGIRAASLVVSCLLTTSAFAAEAEKFAAPQATERVATPGAGSLVQVTLSLVIVLAAVFAAAWAVRRVKTFGRFASGPIEIVADASLGARERAVLVQVGGKQLLLGVAPGNVSVLHVLEEPVNPTQSMNAEISAPGAAQRPDFKSILKRSLGL